MPVQRPAATTTTVRPKPSPTTTTLPKPSPPPVTYSNGWNGYYVRGSVLSATGTVVHVPQPDCSTNPAGHVTGAGYWVGIDGAGNNTVEQIGFSIGCDGTNAAPGGYEARPWVEMWPSMPSNGYTVPLALTWGDSVTMTVTFVAGDTYRVGMTDNTTGKSWSGVFSAPGAQNATAECIMEASPTASEDPQVPGTVDWTGCDYNGGQSIPAPGRQIVTLRDDNWDYDSVYSSPGVFEQEYRYYPEGVT